jgi:hypothetical protein
LSYTQWLDRGKRRHLSFGVLPAFTHTFFTELVQCDQIQFATLNKRLFPAHVENPKQSQHYIFGVNSMGKSKRGGRGGSDKGHGRRDRQARYDQKINQRNKEQESDDEPREDGNFIFSAITITSIMCIILLYHDQSCIVTIVCCKIDSQSLQLSLICNHPLIQIQGRMIVVLTVMLSRENETVVSIDAKCNESQL